MEESASLSTTNVIRFVRTHWRRLLVATGFCLLVVFLFLTKTPNDFPQKKMLTVRENASITEIGKYLEDQHAITSPFAFKWLIRIFNPKNGALSGTYYFEKPENLVVVAYRISRGAYGLTPLIFFVPEGTNAFQLAERAKNTFPDFDSNKLLELAKKDEGYLFPDTYHFLPTVKPEEIISSMRKTFDEKISAVIDDIRAFGRPLDEVIKMASYLEEEARLSNTRRIVAGILWKRLEMGMPLQIDSTFQYINGKNTYQLTTEDLKTDDPYNTYVYKGLTPTPISNPGLGSIEAAVTPIKSQYFFFLTDKDGVMHYAVTHDEHVANKERYLR